VLPFGHQGKRTVDLGLIVVEEVVNQVGRESHEVRGEHQRDEDATGPQRRGQPEHCIASKNISVDPHVNELLEMEGEAAEE